MIVPKILPDEIWLSYYIRLGKINGYKSDKVTQKHLIEVFGRPYENSPLMSVLLSRALLLSVKEFCRFHTLLPVSRAVVTNDTKDVIHGDELVSNLIKYHANKLENRELKSCPSCVTEDISYHGFSYFRREHQFPGFNFCSKHNVRLSRSSRYQFVAPEQVYQIEPHGISADEIGNQYVERYKEIIDSWANAERPIPVSPFIKLMQQRAKNIGLRWSKNGNKSLLSDYIIHKYPYSWIETIIPDINKKVKGQYFASIDRLLTPQRFSSRSSNYALLLSALFECAEEALNSSYECMNDKEIAVVKRKKINSYGIGSCNKLDKLFIECNGLSSSVSKSLGVSESSALEMLIKNGLVPLGRFKKNVLNAFLDFQNGLGLMESSLKHGVKFSDIEQMLRRVSLRQGMAVQAIINKGRTADSGTQVVSTENLIMPYAEDPYTLQ